MGGKVRKIVAEQFLRDPSPSTTLRVRMTAGTCNDKLTATAALLAGLRLQMRFSCLFELSRIRLERKKEWLCNSSKVLLRF
jgi:hypothetical protein